MKQLFIITLFLFLPVLLLSQETHKQTIRGTVVDKVSRVPMPGVNIILLNTDPPRGTITNADGNFRLENVPVGRQGIQISFIGFQTVTLNNLLVNSGKELVLNIALEEKVIVTKEVVIKADRKKDQPINEIATVSARSFTVEETKRYAGSWGDPARMAANYAGVIPVSDERNDIIIRGNSPIGLLWRLDGVEIPNPNHFGALGTTGGPVTILNSNLLTDSDFITGAFPAEYGNALSGAFDLKMRHGNNEKREYWGQMGFNGFELGLEGPFSRSDEKSNKATYLVSYRYSMLDALKYVGFDMGIAPKYQDLTFKIDIPGKNYSRLSIFGIGGISYIEMLDSEKDSTEWTYTSSGEDLTNGSDIGVLGLSYMFYINEKTRLINNLAVLGSRVTTHIDTFDISSTDPFPWYRETSSEIKYSASSHLRKKFNAKNNLGTGVIFDLYRMDYLDSAYIAPDYRIVTDANEYLSLCRAYIQWQHKFSDKLISFSGIHSQILTLNNTWSVEPRIGLKWKFADLHSFNLGFGMHSQIQPRMIYFAQSLMPDGSYISTNKDLDMSKSIHHILGYDYLITENMRLKAEAYYQYLYDIPVEEAEPSYSLLNSGADFYIMREDSLVNEGTGTNYGVELTFEKFFSRNYYFLLTTSFFESKYSGYDKIERNTAFNGNFVFNFLGGYELKAGKNNMLAFDVKTVWAGGKRYIPVDIEQSVAEGYAIYDFDHAFEEKYTDYFKFDFRISYKLNSRKTSQEWALDLLNLSNNKNVFMEKFDPETGETSSLYQTGFFPMMTWRIQF